MGLIIMIENIKKLINIIEEAESELTNIKNEINKLDMERLMKVINIAKRGLKFEKIYSKYVVYNNHSQWRDDEVDYFRGDDGKVLKGIKVADKSIEYNSEFTGGNKEEDELFLMQDGSFKIFNHSGRWSNYQDESSKYYRTVSNNQDITRFDFDEIVENIYKEIKYRISDLGDKSKTQINRLEKLEKLKVS